jgi:hypothetical protein
MSVYLDARIPPIRYAFLSFTERDREIYVYIYRTAHAGVTVSSKNDDKDEGGDSSFSLDVHGEPIGRCTRDLEK